MKTQEGTSLYGIILRTECILPGRDISSRWFKVIIEEASSSTNVSPLWNLSWSSKVKVCINALPTVAFRALLVRVVDAELI